MATTLMETRMEAESPAVATTVADEGTPQQPMLATVDKAFKRKLFSEENEQASRDSPPRDDKEPRKRGRSEKKEKRAPHLTERQLLALVMKKTEEDALLLDVTKRNASGETPLHQASIKGNCNLVVSLLRQGAAVNARDNAGWTPLHEACNYGYTDIVSVLLENNADVNAPGMDNDTPLHDAAVNGHLEVARLLLEHGADPNRRNTHELSPVDIATIPEMQELLRGHGAVETDGRKSKGDLKIRSLKPARNDSRRRRADNSPDRDGSREDSKSPAPTPKAPKTASQDTSKPGKADGDGDREKEKEKEKEKATEKEDKERMREKHVESEREREAAASGKAKDKEPRVKDTPAPSIPKGSLQAKQSVQAVTAVKATASLPRQPSVTTPSSAFSNQLAQASVRPMALKEAASKAASVLPVAAAPPTVTSASPAATPVSTPVAPAPQPALVETLPAPVTVAPSSLPAPAVTPSAPASVPVQTKEPSARKADPIVVPFGPVKMRSRIGSSSTLGVQLHEPQPLYPRRALPTQPPQRKSLVTLPAVESVRSSPHGPPLQQAAQAAIALSTSVPTPPHLSPAHVDLYRAQEKERRETYARMALEVDRLRASVRAEALRICAAAELHYLGVYTDEYLHERDGLIFVNGVPDIEKSIERARQIRFDDSSTYSRHCAEAAALHASQCLEWPMDLEHVVPRLEPPRP